MVIEKTKNRFSAMPIDQAHEQNNALIKRVGWCNRTFTESCYFKEMAPGWTKASKANLKNLRNSFWKVKMMMTIFIMTKGIRYKTI